MPVSSFKRIARTRPPRVQITYDIEVFGAEREILLPFVIGVMSDLAGESAHERPSLVDRRFVEVDQDNFDLWIRAVRPRVAFPVPDVVTGVGDIEVDLVFESMAAFTPALVAAQVPPLERMLRVRTLVQSLRALPGEDSDEPSLIAEVFADPEPWTALGTAAAREACDRRIEQAVGSRSEAHMESARAALAALAEDGPAVARVSGLEPFTTARAFVEGLDAKLTDQVNRILRHPDFRVLEERWRGLQYLVLNAETNETLKIRVLDVSKRELARTLQRYAGTAWDQNPIYKKLNEEVFGQLGGEPFGCLVGDFYFDNQPADVDLLACLARMAAGVHAPFLTGAAPGLLGLEQWQDIARPRDVSPLFQTPEYARWRALRESDDAMYVALTMPRFLARLPYGHDMVPVEPFVFEEDVTPGRPADFVWCNAAYGMATCIARAFSEFGWPARIRGIESGGALEDLPVWTFPTEDGTIDSVSSTEVAISDRWEASLAHAGLMPLLHRKGTGSAVFVSANTLQKPTRYDDPDTTANAALTARLPYLLPCCRFAHYLKCFTRDRIGTFIDRADLERALNEWIFAHVDPEPEHSASGEFAARRPLADAQVVIDETEGRPGSYTAKLYIRPRYQLEGLTTSIRLLVELEHAG